MLLDLREIIGVPGGGISFEYEPDLTGAVFGSVLGVKKLSRAAGNVVNSAGVLTFSANVDAICICVCARCLAEFEYQVHKHISAHLTEGSEDGGDPDGYCLQGDRVDADEIIISEFILGMDDNIRCREDCAGLCEKCGSDLNNGPCSCKTEADPRLAILNRFLDKEDS